MAAIHVRDVPSEIVAALKERAGKNGRSMQKEVLDILIQAAADQPDPSPPDPIELRTTRSGGTGNWSREAVYDGAR